MAAPALPLDTLAQLPQSTPQADGRAKLIKRARAKYLTGPLATALTSLSSPLEKSYRNTIYCAGVLRQEEGALTGTYCGNRWCLVCNRVRLARAINRYKPVIGGWTDCQFVTLTVPNVGADELEERISRMLRDLRRCAEAIRRTDRLTFKALRKLECTHNREREDFHPHFHLTVEGRAAAAALVRRWLLVNPDATRAAQDYRPADPGALDELFKYFTKLVTKRRDASEGRGIIPPVHLDVIFRAMRGRRVFQPMGFTVAPDPVNDEEAEVGTVSETAAVTRPGEVVDWEWSQEAHDWIDASTGECLTGYDPAVPYRELVAAVGRAPP